MDTLPHNQHLLSSSMLTGLDALFEAVKKQTVIQLRWPLVIVCSYLLIYSPGKGLAPEQAHALVGFYLLTNTTLYFVAEELFGWPRFYGPLLLFDTLFLTVVLVLCGGATPDFFIVCFFTIVLSCICNDSRGLLLVTFLAPLIYGYAVFSSPAERDSTFYLRMFFPLVISLFYGYFAQVERIRRVARENEEQAEWQRRAAEEMRRQRERLEALHKVNLAVSSSIIDRTKVLDIFLEKVLTYFPFGGAVVGLRNPATGVLEIAAAKGIDSKAFQESARAIIWTDQVAKVSSPLTRPKTMEEFNEPSLRPAPEEGLLSFLDVPLIADGDRLGSLALVLREPRRFSDDEIEFFSTLAGQAALAIHYSQLFERTQQQANEMQLVSQVKDEFLSVVSHELKTPLNVISGYINILVEGILGTLSPIQEKALQTIVRQCKELDGLINRVLQVSNMETETPRVELQKINFWEFLYELKSAYDYPLSKDIKLNWHFSSDLPTLQSDRGKLKHIIENLINNAVKFTEEGSVTISARYLPDKKLMEFAVADTGIGIPKEKMSAIFDRFRQGDSSDTRAHGGIGLGLYIVKKYSQLLGGTIHVESKPGQGSTFVVRIPGLLDKSAPARLDDASQAAHQPANAGLI